MMPWSKATEANSDCPQWALDLAPSLFPRCISIGFPFVNGHYNVITRGWKNMDSLLSVSARDMNIAHNSEGETGLVRHREIVDVNHISHLSYSGATPVTP